MYCICLNKRPGIYMYFSFGPLHPALKQDGCLDVCSLKLFWNYLKLSIHHY